MKFLIFGTLVLGTVLALLPHVAYLIVKGVSLLAHFKVAYKPFGIAALCLFGSWVALVAYGNMIGRFRYEVKEWTHTDATLPASFDGYRIVHISDIHSGGWIGNEEKLQKVVDKINSLNADLICFTGDLADLAPGEVRPLVPYLQQLKAKDGVVSILGNHDYFPYARFGKKNDELRTKAVEELIALERNEIGWRLLLNESTFIRRGNDSIAIIGTENQSLGAHPVIQRANLTEAMEGTDSCFRILLTHDPTHWQGEVVGKTDIPLTLSGHTHAMQFRIFGWTPSSWVYKECDGLYTEGSQKLYVNIGLGGSMRMRIGATPEITLLTLTSKRLKFNG